MDFCIAHSSYENEHGASRRNVPRSGFDLVEVLDKRYGWKARRGPTFGLLHELARPGGRPKKVRGRTRLHLERQLQCRGHHYLQRRQHGPVEAYILEGCLRHAVGRCERGCEHHRNHHNYNLILSQKVPIFHKP